MNGEERRKAILSRLEECSCAVSASKLAAEFSVSRQAIVQDIALLRAEGAKIASLARGYVFEKTRDHTKVFKMIHSDEDVEEELNLIVDAGGRVDDVFVYHKVYGKVKARMDIHSRRDVQKFLSDISSGKSSLLKNVTSGYHYHTVSADSPAILEHISKELETKGFLAQLQEYEPSELNT